jgi:hypothetical protein
MIGDADQRPHQNSVSGLGRVVPRPFFSYPGLDLDAALGRTSLPYNQPY